MGSSDGLWYCTRESVKTALDEAETARTNAQIDDAIESGSRDVEGLCHRETFAPILATRSFDFPSRSDRGPSWQVRFNGLDLLSATTVTSGGGTTTLTPGQYFPEPRNEGPPYDSIQINLGGSASFDSGATHQRAIAVTGLWSAAADRRVSVGTLSGTLAASTTATATLAWTTARFGVGDILIIDSERMVITERTFVDSTQNLAAGLTDDASATAVSVADGTGFAVEEIIKVGVERMRIVDIVGNTLTVIRAWDGSQLATHTLGDDVYALTGVELARAQAGTTLAAHSASAVVERWVPPGSVAKLARAYAINTLLGERSGWARAISASSDTAVELSGRGIAKLEADVMRPFGRKARHRTIV